MKIFITILLLGFLQVATSRRVRNAGSCPPPVSDKNFKLDWLKDMPEGGFYSEMGDEVGRRYYAQILLDRELTANEDLSQMCSRIKLVYQEGSNPLLIKGMKQGFGGKRALMDCGVSSKYPETFECKYETKYGDLEYMTAAHSTPNYLLQVFCTPSGQRGWFTTSKTPLSKSEMDSVSEHVKSLGLDSTNVQMYNKNVCA